MRRSMRFVVVTSLIVFLDTVQEPVHGVGQGLGGCSAEGRLGTNHVQPRTQPVRSCPEEHPQAAAYPVAFHGTPKAAPDGIADVGPGQV